MPACADDRSADADQREPERRVRDEGAPAREVERARPVLRAAVEVTGRQIAAAVGCAEPTVGTWRSRDAEHGLAGPADLPPGKPAQLPETLRNRPAQDLDLLLEQLVAPPEFLQFGLAVSATSVAGRPAEPVLAVGDLQRALQTDLRDPRCGGRLGDPAVGRSSRTPT